MEINDNKVSEFIAVVEEMVNINPLNDLKATKYNKLFKKADSLLLDIIKEDNYNELIYFILAHIKGEKYWQIHSNLMAGAIGVKDKGLCLEILKLHPDKNELDIIELEKIINKEKKGKGFLGKIFGK